MYSRKVLNMILLHIILVPISLMMGLLIQETRGMFLGCVWKLSRRGRKIEGMRDLEGSAGCNYTDHSSNTEVNWMLKIWNDSFAVGQAVPRIGATNWEKLGDNASCNPPTSINTSRIPLFYSIRPPSISLEFT